MECRVKNESFGRLKMQRVVTSIIKKRLLRLKSCKKHPVRVVSFSRRELPIQDDWDAFNLRFGAMSYSKMVSLCNKLEYSAT